MQQAKKSNKSYSTAVASQCSKLYWQLPVYVCNVFQTNTIILHFMFSFSLIKRIIFKSSMLMNLEYLLYYEPGILIVNLEYLLWTWNTYYIMNLEYLLYYEPGILIMNLEYLKWTWNTDHTPGILMNLQYILWTWNTYYTPGIIIMNPKYLSYTGILTMNLEYLLRTWNTY